VLLAEGKRARQHKSGHSYSLEKFGLDAGAIRSGLADLFEQYRWDEENDDDRTPRRTCARRGTI
jgi:hypothetical protein